MPVVPSILKRAAESEKVDTNPSEARKRVGNYAKKHIRIQGLPITVENPAGSIRSGEDAGGNKWSVRLKHDYGYIRGLDREEYEKQIKAAYGATADGDHIDVFIGPKPDGYMVYVVDQVNPHSRRFDEHKVMLGFHSKEDARRAYLSAYEDGWTGLGGITAVPMHRFKDWVENGDKTRAFAPQKEFRKSAGEVLEALKSVVEGG